MIFIIGCHRSGTSILSRLTHEMLDIHCDHLLEGHYEDSALVSLNEWLLRRAGGSWEYTRPFSTVQDMFKPHIDGAIIEFFRLNPEIYQRFLQKGLLKDPRLSITWMNFVELFQPLKLICIHRDAPSIARSLYTRAQKNPMSDPFVIHEMFSTVEGIEQFRYQSIRARSEAGALAIAEEYHAQIEASLDGCRLELLRLQYDDLRQNPKDVLTRVADFVQASLSEEKLQYLAAQIR